MIQTTEDGRQKTGISPEERAEWRSEAELLFRSSPFGEEHQFGERILRLLDALEATEACAVLAAECAEKLKEFPMALGDALKRAERAEAERDELAAWNAQRVAVCPDSAVNIRSCPLAPPDECCKECWRDWAQRQVLGGKK